MSRQMPELYLRGAIFNTTMRNLTPEQMREVEEKIEILLKTPSLTKSREKFCQTLANTIGADYREDKEATLQEYKIALMKAVIYVLFHKPNRQILDDPVQTRKLFSQFTYNYMKQILNENKIPRNIDHKHIEHEPYVVAYKQILSLLAEEGIFHVSEFKHDKYVIDGDIGLIDLKTARKIGMLKSKYEKMGVIVSADIEKIEIRRKFTHPSIKAKIKTSSRIKVMNFEHESDDQGDINRYHIEFEIAKKRGNHEPQFDHHGMRKILPQHLTEVFDLIVNAKEEYDKGDMAKYLNVSVNEINKRLDQMKYYYYAAKAV
jgi:hypothetical protein